MLGSSDPKSFKTSNAVLRFCVRLPQTKVTSIDGKAVGDQYLPSYLSISSWYSPSRCHIQIQSPSVPLKASIPLPPAVLIASG